MIRLHFAQVCSNNTLTQHCKFWRVCSKVLDQLGEYSPSLQGVQPAPLCHAPPLWLVNHILEQTVLGESSKELILGKRKRPFPCSEGLRCAKCIACYFHLSWLILICSLTNEQLIGKVNLLLYVPFYQAFAVYTHFYPITNMNEASEAIIFQEANKLMINKLVAL